MTRSSLKLTFFTLLLLTSLIHINADVIKPACSQTPDPSLCESLLYGSGGPYNDLEDLMPVIVDIVDKHFQDALIIAQKWITMSQDPDVINGVQKCVEFFQTVTDVDVLAARNAIKFQNYEFAVEPMNDAGTEALSCHNAFPPGKVPRPFTGRTRTLTKISHVAAGLLGLLL